MNKFIQFLLSLVLGILGTLVNGGLIKLIARFGHYPITYRQGCAAALVISLIALSQVKWAEEDAKTWEQQVNDAVRGILGYALFALFVLAFGWGFSLFFS